MTRAPKLLGSRRTRLVAVLMLACALGLIAGMTILFAPTINRSKRADAAAAARRDAAIRAQLARRLARDQRLHLASAHVHAGARIAVVQALQSAIASDARARARAGTMSGPVLRVSCAPYPAGSPTPAGRVGSYSCLAITKPIVTRAGTVGEIGDPFWARVDFASGRLAWCKINPKPGEEAAGSAAAFVPLSPLCDLERPPPRSLP